MNEREKWACITTAPGMYFEKIQKLIESFGNIEEVLGANQKQLMGKVGIDESAARQIVNYRDKFVPELYFKNLEQKNIQFVAVSDKEYPKKLVPYADKPYALFYKGNLPQESVPSVAMIGARACSNYGRNVAKKLGRELSEKGVQVISGMARGIDTYSQLGAVLGQTATFSVLGSGVDICYPTENIELYEEILENGGILSEYPPGSAPVGWHFPKRNRIISGLSDLIVVVEAKEESGSLITVEWALEQGKDVMAVPGRIGDKLSEGCNRLLKSGAGVITSADDIISELKYEVFNEQNKESVKEKILEKDFLLLYSELGLQPKNVYELMKDTNMKYEDIVSILLKLELDGFVEQPVRNYFSKKYT